MSANIPCATLRAGGLDRSLPRRCICRPPHFIRQADHITVSLLREGCRPQDGDANAAPVPQHRQARPQRGAPINAAQDQTSYTSKARYEGEGCDRIHGSGFRRFWKRHPVGRIVESQTEAAIRPVRIVAIPLGLNGVSIAKDEHPRSIARRSLNRLPVSPAHRQGANAMLRFPRPLCFFPDSGSVARDREPGACGASHSAPTMRARGNSRAVIMLLSPESQSSKAGWPSKRQFAGFCPAATLVSYSRLSTSEPC